MFIFLFMPLQLGKPGYRASSHRCQYTLGGTTGIACAVNWSNARVLIPNGFFWVQCQYHPFIFHTQSLYL